MSDADGSCMEENWTISRSLETVSDRSSRKNGRTCAKSANGKRRQPEENQTPVRTKARLTIEELGEKKRGVSQGKLRGTSSRSLSPTFRLPGNYQLFLCITFVSLLSFLPTPLSCVFLRLIHTINLGSLLSFSHSFPLSSPPSSILKSHGCRRQCRSCHGAESQADQAQRGGFQG